MLTRIVKWMALTAAVVLLPLSWWKPTGSVTLVLGVAICAGAIVALVQAMAVRRYYWAIGFLPLAVLFNPAVPITLPPLAAFSAQVACAALFAAALYLLPRTQPLTVQSIVDDSPRRASL